MAKKKTRIEWVGGSTLMPGYVTGEGEPYRAEALLWLDHNGLIRGATVLKPGTLLAGASDNLRQALSEAPPDQTPRTLRVASKALADVLRAGHPSLEIVCAPTPELDAAMASMREAMSKDDEGDQSYLGDDVGPEMMASFFRSAAALFRARPWAHVPIDRNVVVLDIEALGLRKAALVIIGQLGESLGFILFDSLEDEDTYYQAAISGERDTSSSIPAHFALNFERGGDLDPSLRKEIATRGWEVAAANAYPWPVVIDSDRIARAPSAKEVTICEAICLALPKLLSEKPAHDTGWNHAGEPIAFTTTVRTFAGEHEVVFSTRLESDSGGEGDLGPLIARNEVLFHTFAESPEAQPLTEFGFASLLLQTAAVVLNESIEMLDPKSLKMLVFELIPRDSEIPPSAAPAIIAELRAFYAFLDRQFELPQAKMCQRVLTGNAVKTLATALERRGSASAARPANATKKPRGTRKHPSRR